MDLPPPSNEAHLWRIPLDQPLETRVALWDMLSDDEKRRSDRFAFQRDRDRFIVGRGAMRRILSRYTGFDPAEIKFDYSPRGKPSLAHDDSRPNINFNLSHSEGLAVLAVNQSELGVDIELIRPLPDMAELAAHYFAEEEQDWLAALPVSERLDGFFHCWTHKEAILKATGDGIGDQLCDISVTLSSDHKPRIHRSAVPAIQPDQWRLHTVAPSPGFAGALALKSNDCRIRDFAWDPAQ